MASAGGAVFRACQAHSCIRAVALARAVGLSHAGVAARLFVIELASLSNTFNCRSAYARSIGLSHAGVAARIFVGVLAAGAFHGRAAYARSIGLSLAGVAARVSVIEVAPWTYASGWFFAEAGTVRSSDATIVTRVCVGIVARGPDASQGPLANTTAVVLNSSSAVAVAHIAVLTRGAGVAIVTCTASIILRNAIAVAREFIAIFARGPSVFVFTLARAIELCFPFVVARFGVIVLATTSDATFRINAAAASIVLCDADVRARFFVGVLAAGANP